MVRGKERSAFARGEGKFCAMFQIAYQHIKGALHHRIEHGSAFCSTCVRAEREEAPSGIVVLALVSKDRVIDCGVVGGCTAWREAGFDEEGEVHAIDVEVA
jgi:hypothetical protein